MAANADALRAMAAGLRDRAQDVRDLGDVHMNEALSMEWRSDSADAFTARTISDHVAVHNAASRIDAVADVLFTHADATEAGAAEAARVAALGDGPGRNAL